VVFRLPPIGLVRPDGSGPCPHPRYLLTKAYSLTCALCASPVTVITGLDLMVDG
jgi:hypothetical protein